jgi:serine/threonine-protein kinase
MSPEQAMGEKVIDARSDIYALGAVTYEMLVGEPPFTGPTVQAIVAKAMTERPVPLHTIRDTIPPGVEHAVLTALAKLPADRFATAAEFASALATERTTESTSSVTYARPAVSRRTRPLTIAALAVALLATAAAAWGWLRPRDEVEGPVIRANFDLPPGARINDVITGTTIAVSPSGDMIAFTTIGVSSGFRMYLRRINELTAHELIDAAGRNLTFSPDGRWLAFTEGNVLKKVSVDGQAATVGTTGSAVPYGLSWSKSDTIYVGSFSGMWAIPATGGTATRALADSSEMRTGKRWPLVLPGGTAIAFVKASNPAEPQRLAVMTIGTGKIQVFDLLVAMPLGLLGDQLVYVSPSGGLMAVRFDNAANRPVGDAVQLDEGVLFDMTAGAKASLSPSGTLAYLRGRAQFQPVMAAPGTTAPTPLISEPGVYSTPRFSPEGRRVAITVVRPNATDIWIYDVARNTFTRLTTEGVNIRPEWTPDGRQVIFISTRDGNTGIWRQPADGSGPAELLYQPELEPFEAVVSPDMKWLLFRTAPGARYSRDILAVPLTGDRTVTPVVTGPETESMPRLSPDGKWLAYHSNETGRFEVYVRPFPATGARIQVSDVSGSEPIWGRSGRKLYYRGAVGEIVEVDVTTGTDFSIGARRVVLSGDYLTDSSHPNYDVAPDGRFLMLKRAGAESQTIVVHNWGRELREKTATTRR